MLQLVGQCSQIDFFFLNLLSWENKKGGDNKVQEGQTGNTRVEVWRCGDCDLRYDSQDEPH